MIDRGEYVEAAKELNDYLKSHPEDQRARVVLASVYVSRAGLAISDYFKLEKVFADQPKSEKKLVNVDSFANNKLAALSQTLGFLNDLNQAADEISARFEDI